MKFKLGCSVFALAGAVLPFSPALAQGTEFGADGLVGVVRDDRDPADNDEWSGGALPSVLVGGNGVMGQADGMVFDHAGDTAFGGALHLGARLGEGDFIGLYGSISEVDRAGGLSTKRVGAEVRVSTGPFWISGLAGIEDAERKTVFIRTTATDDVYDVYGAGDSFFAFADLGVRPSASTQLSVGFRRTGDRNAAAATVAVGVTPRLALMFQGRAGSGDYKAVFAGLRLRFGGPAGSGRSELLDNRLFEDLFTASSSRRRLLDPLPPPPPPEEEECGSCGGYCDED